jgi:hypothetical protein
MWPDGAWQFVDDEDFIRDWTEDMKNNYGYDDFSEDDFRTYIDDNWSENVEDEVIDIYSEKNGVKKSIKAKEDGIIKVKEKETYPYNFKVKIKTKDGKVKKYKIPEEHEVIFEDGEKIGKGAKISILKYDDTCFDEYDFVEEMIDKRYEDYSAQEIVEEIYGQSPGGRELYQMISYYLDEDEFKEHYKDNEDFYYKKEFVESYIDTDINLQKEILDKNKNAVIELAELFVENSSNSNIADEYDFQKLYIEKFVEQEKDEDSDEKDMALLKAKAIKFLYDNFELEYNIEDEYEDYMWLVSSDKYNL